MDGGTVLEGNHTRAIIADATGNLLSITVDGQKFSLTQQADSTSPMDYA